MTPQYDVLLKGSRIIDPAALLDGVRDLAVKERADRHPCPCLRICQWPGRCRVKATIQVVEANCDIVKGIKLHAEIGGYQLWGNAVMKLAKEIPRETRLPLYTHLGRLWALLADNDGIQVTAERMLTSLFCLRGGRRIDADAPILPNLAAV